jgi:hypothetical protein
MADVNKIQGPNSPNPLSDSGKKDKVPSDQFQKMMKIDKVRETDPEEKRKRRERAEKEEEPEQEEESAAPLPSKEFSAPLQEPSLGKLGATGAPTSPTAPTPSSQPSPTLPEEGPISEPAPVGAKPAPSSPAPSPTAEKKGEGPPPKHGVTPPLGSLPFPLEQAPAEMLEEELAPLDEEPALEEKGPLPPDELPKKEEKKEEPPLPLETIAPDLSIAQPHLDSSSPIGSSYLSLPPQILDIFERMAGVMTVMTASGISETTIHLNAESFASSVFYGSQIIIKEYSTAPKEFNIQFNTTERAAPIFQAHVDDLLAAFQGGKYAFRVRRCETALLEREPFLFKRKEKTGDKGGESA